MPFRPLFVVFCLVSSQLVADEQITVVESAASAQDNIDFRHDGIWKPKGAMLSGVLLPPPALKAITLTIKDDMYKVTDESDEHSDSGTFTLDTSTTPKRMTIKSTSGPNKGKTFLAIYEVKNANAFRACYDLSGKEFPTEFKAPKGSERYLVGYRRQVADADKAAETQEAKPDTP